MTNSNKRAVIDLNDTPETKRPRHTPLPPPPDLLLAQIHSAISAATTLLATLSNLVTTISHAAPPASPATQAPNQTTIQSMSALPESLATTFEPIDGVLAHIATVAPVGVFADLATLAPNPATDQAAPAPPESLATTLEPMVGVLVDLATLA
jgi:hypothetical protein